MAEIIELDPRIKVHNGVIACDECGSTDCWQVNVSDSMIITSVVCFSDKCLGNTEYDYCVEILE